MFILHVTHRYWCAILYPPEKHVKARFYSLRRLGPLLDGVSTLLSDSCDLKQPTVVTFARTRRCCHHIVRGAVYSDRTIGPTKCMNPENKKTESYIAERPRWIRGQVPLVGTYSATDRRVE